MKKYLLIEDPGHAWLEVSQDEIDELGLIVSRWSYKDGPLVYLEEDCDMINFCKEMRAQKGIEIRWSNIREERFGEGFCFVRNLPKYED